MGELVDRDAHGTRFPGGEAAAQREIPTPAAGGAAPPPWPGAPARLHSTLGPDLPGRSFLEGHGPRGPSMVCAVPPGRRLRGLPAGGPADPRPDRAGGPGRRGLPAAPAGVERPVPEAGTGRGPGPPPRRQPHAADGGAEAGPGGAAAHGAGQLPPGPPPGDPGQGSGAPGPERPAHEPQGGPAPAGARPGERQPLRPGPALPQGPRPLG